MGARRCQLPFFYRRKLSLMSVCASRLGFSERFPITDLQALLHACHRVLPNIEGREDELAEAIRETCRTVEARLRELGVDPLVPER
jgi:hypothetical protein